jgi:hypothetical protein
MRTRLCVPAKATFGQVIAVVVKFLEDNPARQHEQVSVLAWTAVASA